MRDVVLASTRCVSRSPRVRRDPLSDHPADRQPAEREGLHAERIGDRQRVPAELLDAVLAGRRIARAVAAQVVAQHLEMPLEIRGLRIPHAVVEPERMRQHHDRTPRRAGQAVIVTNAVSDNEGHGRSTLPDRSAATSAASRLRPGSSSGRSMSASRSPGTASPSDARSTPANAAPLRRLSSTASRDQPLRVVASQQRRQPHHRPPGVDDAAGRLEVLPHSLRIDGEAFDGVGQRAHRRSGRLHGRGDDWPLGLAAAGAPFVLLDHRRQVRGHERRHARRRRQHHRASGRDSACAASSTIRHQVRRPRQLRPASTG